MSNFTKTQQNNYSGVVSHGRETSVIWSPANRSRILLPRVELKEVAEVQHRPGRTSAMKCWILQVCLLSYAVYVM